ncbi:MAG: hypothetical protein ABI629_01695 [bacterium]
MKLTDLRSATVHLIGSVLFLACLLGVLSSCGTDDLLFPGNVPATSTAEPTGVPTLTPTPI